MWFLYIGLHSNLNHMLFITHFKFIELMKWMLILGTCKGNEPEATTKDNKLSIIQQLQITNTNKNIIIIDSLTPLIMNIGFTKCYRELHYLSRSKNGK